MPARALGLLPRMVQLMECIDMNEIASQENKITGAYRAPGG